MDDGALDDALETGRRLGVLVAFADQVLELGFEIRRQAAAQLVEIDVAGAHDGGRILIVEQCQQQVFQRGVFMVPLVGQRQRAVQGLFEAARKGRHFILLLPSNSLCSPGVPSLPRCYIALPAGVSMAGQLIFRLHFTSFPSRTGEDAWCLRAKSITSVTLLLAAS